MFKQNMNYRKSKKQYFSVDLSAGQLFLPVEVAGVVTVVGDAVDGTVVAATVTYGKSVKKVC